MGADWGPVVVAVVMFVLLSPGLLFQLPARARVIEFGNMYTSGISILVHAILYVCIYTILIIAIGVHIRTAGVDVNMDGKDEDSVDDEEDESVDCDGLAVGLHAPEIQVFVVSRELKEQSRLQEHE
ncbi:unnamed protein product [Ilex paraguariensis]|uniref:Uncharacterized protein n=1 Tax=Ilex paraguariensis TaxID=185542 RepID=A0ABC8U055_9AQUA